MATRCHDTDNYNRTKVQSIKLSTKVYMYKTILLNSQLTLPLMLHPSLRNLSNQKYMTPLNIFWKAKLLQQYLLDGTEF